jgi:hypothetical protein
MEKMRLGNKAIPGVNLLQSRLGSLLNGGRIPARLPTCLNRDCYAGGGNAQETDEAS